MRIWGTRGIPSSYLYSRPKVRCPPLDHTSNCATLPPFSPARPLRPHISRRSFAIPCVVTNVLQNLVFSTVLSNTTPVHTNKTKQKHRAHFRFHHNHFHHSFAQEPLNTMQHLPLHKQIFLSYKPYRSSSMPNVVFAIGEKGVHTNLQSTTHPLQLRQKSLRRPGNGRWG